MTGCYVNTFLSPLSLERETECLKKVAQNDKEAKDELILHNMRLVAHVTKKYAVSEDEMEELISIGTIGLIKAVSSFKADYGNRFATFATVSYTHLDVYKRQGLSGCKKNPFRY